jgi:O-acetyl-ADP-ribose deacetylase
MTLPIDIEIWQGEIAELEVDAIIIPSNESLFMTAPVAASVKRHAVEDVEKQAVAQGPVKAGSAIVTSGGRLAAPYIIHAVAIGHDLRRDRRRLRKAVESALNAVKHLSLRTIAISTLGAERGVFLPSEAAEIMLEAILDRMEVDRGMLETVVVAVTRSEERAEYVAALERVVARAAALPAESA